MAEVEGDYIKTLEIKLLDYQEMLETCNRLKKDIESETLLFVQAEADKKSTEGDKSLSNEAKRKAYQQELLQKHETYPKIDSKMAGYVHDMKLIEIELGYQKRKFYREMASIIAVVREVSGA